MEYLNFLNIIKEEFPLLYLKTNKNLTNILVGPFASEGDIKANQELLNQIAGIQAGEVLTWNP